MPSDYGIRFMCEWHECPLGGRNMHRMQTNRDGRVHLLPASHPGRQERRSLEDNGQTAPRVCFNCLAAREELRVSDTPETLLQIHPSPPGCESVPRRRSSSEDIQRNLLEHQRGGEDGEQ